LAACRRGCVHRRLQLPSSSRDNDPPHCLTGAAGTSTLSTNSVADAFSQQRSQCDDALGQQRGQSDYSLGYVWRLGGAALEESQARGMRLLLPTFG
jgi:hypothetical protein